jgi:hypothetical protein
MDLAATLTDIFARRELAVASMDIAVPLAITVVWVVNQRFQLDASLLGLFRRMDLAAAQTSMFAAWELAVASMDIVVPLAISAG